jgi:pimeloyl-ACP methyl ester carboxylesterase
MTNTLKTLAAAAIAGTEDGAIAPELLRSTARRIGAETIKVPGSHVVFLTQPKAVADVIDAAAQAVGATLEGQAAEAETVPSQ